MESFLVYLFNFYYAISELEQNKQNNTIIIFFTIYFFNKKVDLSSLRRGAGAPIAPPLPTGLLTLTKLSWQLILRYFSIVIVPTLAANNTDNSSARLLFSEYFREYYNSFSFRCKPHR